MGIQAGGDLHDRAGAEPTAIVHSTVRGYQLTLRLFCEFITVIRYSLRLALQIASNGSAMCWRRLTVAIPEAFGRVRILLPLFLL